MEKALFHTQNSKSKSTHIKRYSDHNFRAQKTDNLLITQPSLLYQGLAFSQQTLKSIKSKFPITGKFSKLKSPMLKVHSQI